MSRCRRWLPVAIVLMLAFFASVPVAAQQDPLDLGAADSAYFVISEPVVGAVDQVVTAELYVWHDVQDMGSMSGGYSWDNPNFVMESASFSPEATAGFDMMRLVYYQNTLTATNENQFFQSTGLRIFGPGLLAAPAAQLIATYTFRVSSWSVNDQFCIDLAEFTPLAFVDFDNKEYVPIYDEPFCVGSSPSGVLEVSPSMLEFYGVEGEDVPTLQNIFITESSGGSIDYNIEEGAVWITLQMHSGTTPYGSWVGINSSGLSAGDYVDSIHVTSAEANNDVWVRVNLHLDASGDSPPVLSPIGDQSVVAGSLLEFTVTATDADMDPITLTVDSLPVGATFVDYLDGTGHFAWTPTQVGSYAVVFSAIAGNDMDFEFVMITVYDGGDIDQGAPDRAFFVISDPVVGAVGQIVTAELYVWHDIQNLANLSSGFSWDNPNFVMESASFSAEATAAFALARLVYYQNSLDATNANQIFQATGLRMNGEGLPASTTPQLVATYSFRVSSWSAGDRFCIGLADFVELVFVDPASVEYSPVWTGPECVGTAGGGLVADFSASPTTGTAPLMVLLTDESTYGNLTDTSWLWNFGDGLTATSQNVFHLYQIPGYYTVSLQVSGSGESDTETKVDYIYVSGGDQDPLDEGAADSLLIELVQLTESTLAAEVYVFNDVQDVSSMGSGFAWDNHAFFMDSVVWSPEALVAFNMLHLSYRNNSLDSTNAHRLFQTTGLTSNTNLLFASPVRKLVATYYFHVNQWPPGTVCLSLNNFISLGFVEFGGPEYVPVWGGTQCIDLDIAAPQADFSATPTSGTAPLEVSFTDMSTGGITGWEWNFGDSTYSAVQHPMHTYTTPGQYTVSLTVGGPGGSSTETKVDYIRAEPSSGVQDTLAMEMDAYSSSAIAVELYAFNDEANLANFSSGFSWDNPAFRLDSAVWSEAASSTYDLFLGLYPMNSLDSANSRQQFQATGLRRELGGLPASSERQLLATYYFHSDQAVPGDNLCVELDDWVHMIFVGPDNIEYTPIWTGNECEALPLGDPDVCRTQLCLQGEVVNDAVNYMCVTAGMDEQAETRDMPPEPPEYSCYLQIWGEPGQGAGPYGVDVRQFGNEREEWLLDINPKGTVGSPLSGACATLSWDPATLCPDGYYWLVDRGLDNMRNTIVVADMRTVTEYELCGPRQSHYYTMVWSDQVCLERTFVAGWQMISLPIVPVDASVETLFPGYLAAWEFNPGAGYVVATEFEPCRGYWLKLAAPATVTVCGPPVTDCSNAYSSGWHMIGGPGCVVGAPPPTNPSGLLAALWGFNWSRGYVMPDSLRPWQGYWVKMGADGDLLLDCMNPGIVTGGQNGLMSKTDGSAEFILSARTDDTEGLNRSEVVLGTDSEMRRYPSAPVPPEYSVYLELYASDGDGPFYRDVRMASEEGASWLVSVRSSGVGSVHLAWDPNSLTDSYQLVSGHDVKTGKVLVEDMRDISEYDLQVSSESEYLTVVRLSGANGSGESLPGTYVLEQCYPNPFNPATEIKFGLPVAGDARLEIFNVLGQRVRTLVDEFLAEGWYTFTWDGTDDHGQSLSTGVYLYRLNTEGYASSKKMLLLK